MAPIPSQLLLLLDSRSPAGAHGHSGGMEAAVNAGFVDTADDVARFCRGRLHTAGRVTAAFASTAQRLWRADGSAADWLELDTELSARTPSPALRTASRALGAGLRRLLRASYPGHDLSAWRLIEQPAPHHPLVLGAACALAGADDVVAARAAALGVCSGPASAAVRLLGLDPYAVHSVLAALGPEIDAIADECAVPRPLAELPAHSALTLDLLADVHSTEEVRLFAS
jgi:urease accessory protein